MNVRPVCSEDLTAILAILNREIREGVAHFGLEEMTLAVLKREFEEAGATHPWFVAFEEDVLLGFARASRWKSRGAYARTAEVGVYATPETQGKGVGTAIYEAFLPACQAAGLHTLLAGIRLPNAPCVRLHERFGFAKVGEFPQVGFKFGEWHDVGYWARVPEVPLP